ncbi:MAG TPA: BTAD domain-containing putative transcriptional regulator [Umezawaea sp.]|nr:BTAD domain-containing putative transcriptional regulator [Umezawaea sp.]
MSTGLRFALLGPIRAWRGAEEVKLGSPQQKLALALLLLREGRPVSVDEIVDAVWGAAPPRGARGTVRTYVNRLRRLLSPADDGLITSVRGGYAMSVEAGAVDWSRFRTRVAAARQARARGALRAASDQLRSAHDLWQGTALSELRGDFADEQRTRLEEARAAALEERLEIDLALGKHASASAELAEAVAANPTRERLRELLMTALVASGRQAEARAVYDEGRRLLVARRGAGLPRVATDGPGPPTADAGRARRRERPAGLPTTCQHSLYCWIHAEV